MAGVDIEITEDDREIREALNKLQNKTRNLTPAFRIIGEIVRTSVIRNFEKGGRPKKWKGLAAATIAQRMKKGTWPGKILMIKGMLGGLAGSIAYKVFRDMVKIGTNKIYGAIQHLGGKAGRGHKVTIPARHFLMLQKEDETEIIEELNDYIMGGL